MLTIDDALTLWDLKVTSDPVITVTGIIVFVTWQGEPAVLKVAGERSDEETAAVLAHYQGKGAVTLLQHQDNASLLEHINPGRHVKELVASGDDRQATEIITQTILQLHSKPEFEGSFPSISDWGKGFERYIDSGDTQIPSSLIEKATAIYHDLIQTQGQPLLLHGDLHHDNILYDEKRGWLAIDPKGVIGEAEYEIGAMLRNPIDHNDIASSSKVITQRLDIITDMLGFDKERVVGWAFSQAVLAGIWSVESQDNPNWAVTIASAFDS